MTAEEWTHLVAAVRDQEFRDFLFAMKETGCRPGEIRKVTSDDINLEHGIWVLMHHKMRKLLHLVFAIGHSGQPFDPNHSPWKSGDDEEMKSSDTDMSLKEDQVASLTPDQKPARSEATATRAANVGSELSFDERHLVDFNHGKQ